MAFGLVSLEKRLKENIKNYSLDQIYDMELVTDLLKTFADLGQCSFLLTDRHGEKMVSAGAGFAGRSMDTEKDPGEMIKVSGRTIAHLYMKSDNDVLTEKDKKYLSLLLRELTAFGQKSFDYMETSLYVDELESHFEKEQFKVSHGEKTDPLTGVFNHTYFNTRMKIIERSEVLPVAIIHVNINDWKYADDHFGHEQSDRLIRVVAGFLKDEARPDYVIGRCGGDSFIVLIPMAEEGEAEEFCVQLQQDCMSYVDDFLSPSVAYGFVTRTNVEERMEDLLSDAEYEMFHHKLEVKNAPGYRERLTKA